MVVNEDPTFQADDDQSSLFGSPPPSPTRGRSPLPNLALPSASGVETGSPISGNISGSCSTQNVGTIALPGSHLYSELPVNPLALSLSYAPREHALRPPAQPQTTLAPRPRHAQIYIPAADIPTPSPSWTRASSSTPTTAKKRNTKVKAGSESVKARSTPPISLPDPSNPPPRNFLRNQSALLGTAGLVGGIKPSKLSVHRHTRGTTMANPIVVEDEHDPPRLGLNHGLREASLPTIDPALLPAPSNKDIVATLMRQKDIFPVLESILKLMAAGSSTPKQRPAHQPVHSGPDWRSSSRISQPNKIVRESSVTSEGHPTKKRKLNRVPAGATDWDVPYPFPDGEGPQEYKTTWERERGKQLISQLVGLIKTAARKAATRTYLQREELRKYLGRQNAPKVDPIPHSETMDAQSAPKVKGHYRPITVTYGLDRATASAAQAMAQDVLTDASNGSSKGVVHGPYSHVGSSSSSDAGSGTVNAQPSTPFDQLIASLLAASPEQGGGGAGEHTKPIGGGQPSMLSVSMSTDDNQTEFDPALFDSWMSILQTFPVPEEGFAQGQVQGQSQHQRSQSPASVSVSSANIDSTPFDANFAFNFHMETHSPSTSSVSTSATACPISDSTRQSQDMSVDMGAGAGDGHNLSSGFLTSTETLPPYAFPHFSIDPTLLGISIPQTHQASVNDTWTTDTTTRPPSLVSSPMLSTSSLADPDLMTPSSAGWETGTPEIFSGSGFSEDGRFYRIGRDAGHGGGGQGAVEDAANVLSEMSVGLAKDKQKATTSKNRDGERTGTATQQLGTMTTPETHFATSTASQVQMPTTAVIGMVSATSAPPPTAPGKTLNKHDILRRAKEQRRQLSEEIARAKIQLWETTIEQGALAHLEKQLSS